MVLVAAACRAQDGGGERTVRGVLTDVQASSIARPDSITLRATDGKDLRLRVAESVSETPGHLRQHMALGEPATVTYRETSEGLVATRLTWGHGH